MTANYPTFIDCAYAYGQPQTCGVLKSQLADFQVEETLSFELSGEGEHLYLQVRKQNSNTEWVVRQLAKFYQVKPMDIGYAGLKDKQAITTQWFSVYLAGKGFPDTTGLNNDSFEILQQHRHDKKLRRGALKHNRFKLILRDVTHPEQLTDRLQNVIEHGVPNYFGQQRFGHNESNITQAIKHFDHPKRRLPRFKRQLYLSAVRSFLFNQILSERIKQGNWQQALQGDVLQLANTHSVFMVDTLDDDIKQRVLIKDLSPTGVLWGKPKPEFTLAGSPTQVITEHLSAQYPELTAGLENAGMKQDHRALRLMLSDVDWRFDESNHQLHLAFDLATGCYATSVLREIICV